METKEIEPISSHVGPVLADMQSWARAKTYRSGDGLEKTRRTQVGVLLDS